MASFNEPPTRRQLEYIEYMINFSPYPLPPFDGKTKKDASEYIDRWKRMANEDIWAITHGYF